MSISGQIQELQALLRAGAISDSEFEEAKRRLLGIAPAVASDAASPIRRHGPSVSEANPGSARTGGRSGFLAAGGAVAWLAYLWGGEILEEITYYSFNPFDARQLLGGILYFGTPLVLYVLTGLLLATSARTGQARGVLLAAGVWTGSFVLARVAWGYPLLPASLLGLAAAALGVAGSIVGRRT